MGLYVFQNIFLLAVLNFSTIYNAPLYFIAVRLRTSTDAGVHLIPFSVTIAAGSIFTGWYMRKTGRYWWLQAFACLCSIVTNLALASWYVGAAGDTALFYGGLGTRTRRNGSSTLP